jgi:hypothetical protein
MNRHSERPLAYTICALLLVAFGRTLLGCGTNGEITHEPIPDWARTGSFSFARWDGGPIEVSKGILSGWPGFTVSDPQVIYATRNLYDPRTIELVERAHVNWIWVTWSTGFSNQTEEAQQVLLRSYIEECHRHGIHVTAYMSIGNIFWEDMFMRVPESKNWILKKNGQPIPYGAADYGAVGRVTRYMADLSLEAWQEYTLGRVMAAVNAGADGIVFDNSSSLYSRELLEQFTASALVEARKRNPQVLLSSNYHWDTVIAARSENAITTEDGLEPGLYDSPGPPADRWNQTPYFVKVPEGFLALNAGLLHTLWAVSEGVRPVTVEYGNRHSGDRFLNTFSAAHQKLALAECAAFHAVNEQFHESKTLRDLFFNEQAAVENWNAVAQYNSFFQQNAPIYQEPKSLAGVAVVIEAAVHDIAFLNTLAARNVIYDVVFEEDAKPENLARYPIVIAAPSVGLRPGWKRFEDVPQKDLDAISPGNVFVPDWVVVNMHGQSQTNRMLIHLLNYADTPVFDFDVKVNGQFASAHLLSPDIDSRSIPVFAEGQLTRIQIPELRVYDLVVLEP